MAVQHLRLYWSFLQERLGENMREMQDYQKDSHIAQHLTTHTPTEMAAPVSRHVRLETLQIGDSEDPPVLIQETTA